MTITIIGASFAGIHAAIQARVTYPQEAIQLIDKKPDSDIGYLPSGLQLYLNNTIPSLDTAFFTSAEAIRAAGVNLITQTAILDIQTDSQTLTGRQSGQLMSFSYDKLIIATGSQQVSRQITGLDSPLIVRCKSLAQSKQGLATLANSHDVAIIGGGHVGLEMADALVKHQKNVTIFESMDTLLLKYFDADMLTPLIKEMATLGIKVHLKESVTQCETLTHGLKLTTTQDTYLQDAAVFSLSVFPRLPFLGESIACHEDQTIVVDQYLQTTANNVFAIGDCIQIAHTLDKSLSHVPLINNAIRTAEVAVANLMTPQIAFNGSLRTIGTHLFGYYLASTGVTATESIFSAEPMSWQIHHFSFSLFSPDKSVTAKIIYHTHTQKILGAQLISKEPILEKIDTLALAIQTGLTLTDLRQKDFFFQPAYTPLVSITNDLGTLPKDVSHHETR